MAWEFAALVTSRSRRGTVKLNTEQLRLKVCLQRSRAPSATPLSQKPASSPAASPAAGITGVCRRARLRGTRFLTMVLQTVAGVSRRRLRELGAMPGAGHLATGDRKTKDCKSRQEKVLRGQEETPVAEHRNWLSLTAGDVCFMY
ncbi:uncharacterized protein LOC144250142 [Urocitellus parryii]